MMIDAEKAKKVIDDYLKDVTLEQLNKDLTAAGMGFYANKNENFIPQSKFNDGVIKRVCSEATNDCTECVCSKPHERHFISEDDTKPCTKWNYCHYKGRKVRCTKVL